ncbi:hypothetical protein C7S20_00935 [Christiangramia fulva]|uniref:Uncharacterized protein n=1 Tax=Christiangramia fulva TaxID=2126553 RepID=A0A2R3Z116_9FLAO|nr:hypothetical protein [Christiangramia fulva]AVR43944.1 hypothetical protein C7S20_00935 [Christiangramia fulva]
MDRKSFLQKTSASLLVIPAITLLGCSSDSGDEMENPNPNPNPGDTMASGNCLDNGTEVAISANHGHELTVSKEDVAAGTAKTYTLSQASTDQHTHQVTLTSAQFSELESNHQITATSTNQEGHTHNVTVSCA